MRICFVYDALFPYVKGGAERRYHELAKRLALEHEVHHVSWQWWEGASTTVIDGVTLHGVGAPPKLYGEDGKRTVREAVAFATRISPFLLRHRFDVIDCSATPYVPLYAAASAARITGTPLVATWHEFWGEHWREYLPDRPAIARVAQALEARARPLGSAAVAVSAFTQRRMGIEASPRSWIVPNGVDISIGARSPAADRGETWDLAFIGRLIDEKRVDRVLDAVHELSDDMPALRCAIVGDGPARAALEARAEALGVTDRVRFLGAVSEAEAHAVLDDAPVLVMPSEREGFGISVIEAQLAGAVPVVVRGPHSAAPDLVRDGVDGLLADPDPASLAGAVRRLLTDDAERRTMRAAALEAARRFAWDDIAGQMLGVYRAVAAAKVSLASAT
ncbi:MAG: glycosyltransferase family 4 protein [Chloroflexota bacterium]